MSMIAIWKFDFTGLSLAYSNVAGISGYTRKILNFSGINIHCDLTSGAIPEVSTSFEIEDAAHVLSVSDFIDEDLTITLISDETPATLNRQWKLIVTSATYSYGTIKVECKSELNAIEDSQFPPYASVAAIAPETGEIPENRCIPYTIGRAYIPIYPILTEGVRRYLLGKSADVTGDFTIYGVRSPRDYPSNDFWDSSYTYEQENKSLSGTTCKITTLIIARSTVGGDVDSNGIFQTSGSIMSPLVDYEGDVASKHPGAFILDVLEKAGITNCDDDSFTDVDDDYFEYVNWSGGWWELEDFETLVSGLLAQCDCYLTFDDEIHFNLFDSAPVETLNKSMIIEDSYIISAIRKTSYDGGLVRWCWANQPQDILTGEHPVRFSSSEMNSGNLPEKIDTSAFEYRFGRDETYAYASLQFGILHFQKKHTKKAQISFTTKLDKLETPNTLSPGQVIQINDSSTGITQAYDTNLLLIYDMTINPDLTVDISAYAYDELEDFPTVSTYAVYPEGDTGIDIPIPGAIEGDPALLGCVNTELYDIYAITPTGCGTFLTKAEAKTAAAALWRSLEDDAKWEPFDGEDVTTNHTWTGDTSDFAIGTENLTGSFLTSESKSLSLATLTIHAESLRINSAVTISGTTSNTYCRIKITDEDSTVRYFYLGVGNDGSGWSDTTTRFLVGDGEVEIVLADYDLVETITDISIECAVAAGDTSLDIEIGYIDFEYCHDLFDDCATCETEDIDVGAYVVLTDTVAYTFYFDGCADGGETSTDVAFRAWLCAGSTTITGSETVVCDAPTFNFGNNYDETTGIFTAPVNGLYFFGAEAVLYDDDDTVWGSIYTYIEVTSQVAAQGWNVTNMPLNDNEVPVVDRYNVNMSGIVFLFAGDEVTFCIGRNNGSLTCLYPQFWGYIIREVAVSDSFFFDHGCEEE